MRSDPAAGASGRRRAMGRGIRIGVAGVVIALLGSAVSGCSSHPAATTAAAQQSAWQQTLDQVQPDGSVSLPTALSAFSQAIGPIPGAPTAPASASSNAIPSGTIAIEWILAKWNQLSAAQQKAVRGDLGVPAGGAASSAPTSSSADAAAAATGDHVGQASLVDQAADAKLTGGTPPPAPNPQLPCATSDSAGAAPYRAQLAGIESDIASQLGRSLNLSVYFSVNTSQLEGASKMYTWPCQGSTPSSNGISGCTIHINPAANVPGYTDADRHDFLIHEVMHCFLFDEFGLAYDSMPAWYLEGVPTWVMTVLGTGDPVSSADWVQYLNTPTESLFQRSYDALGFYAQMAQSGIDVWKAIDPIGSALQSSGDSSQAGWNAAGITQQFLDSWGSGYANGRYPGAAWDATGPNLPHYTDAVPQGSLASGGTVTLSSPAAATAIEQVDIDAQVVEFVPGTATGGRISLDGDSDVVLSDADGVDYCTLGSACTCPSGSAGDGTDFTPLSSGEHYLTETGGLNAGSMKAVGMTLADACKNPSKSCLVGSWTGTDLSVSGTLNGSGGAGVELTIDPTGKYTLDLSTMQPVDFTGQNGMAGDFVYGGAETAVLNMPAPGATGGTLTFQPDTLGIGSLTIALNLTSPISYTFGPVDASEFAAQEGSDMQDTPGSGATWKCQDNNSLQIIVNPIPQVDGQWSFTRAG
jgi:hypothetical protein